MTDSLTVLLNGVTGRMGYRQHLLRSVLAIREQGGVLLESGERIQLEPILLGRSEAKLAELCRRHDLEHYRTDLDRSLAEDSVDIYFDAQTTAQREKAVLSALEAGTHVYTEKPLAETYEISIELTKAAAAAGVTVGVVHDKIYLPGLLKLRRLIDSGFFGRLLSIRGEFGYWVFEGDQQPGQRPSWNYRAADGGGIVLDMFCHWNYVLEHLAGAVQAVTARSVTHIPRRWESDGTPYTATADDAAYGIFELDAGVIAQINSSWCVRVNRDELVEFQLDGTHGSAVAGLRGCRIQPRDATPAAVWNPDLADPIRHRDGWLEVPDNTEFDNGFKYQWEEFVRDVVAGRPHRWDFASATRGVRLAEAAQQSSAEGRRIELTELA